MAASLVAAAPVVHLAALTFLIFLHSPSAARGRSDPV
jgi:hypothetical protein